MTKLERLKEAVEHLEQARSILTSGPLDYYLDKLVHHSEALCTRFAPIKVGQKARIVKDIECAGGWKGCEKTLAVGQIGVVVEVDFDKRFIFTFVPNMQWWQDSNTKEYHVKDRHNSFCLDEDKLELIENLNQEDLV